VSHGGTLRDRYATLVLARWLSDWRSMTGASQRTVARLAGIDQGGLSRIERGLATPSGWRLARIVIVLDWLSGGGDRAGPWAPAESPPRYGFDRREGPRPPRVVGRPALPPLESLDGRSE
jgi:transcriptional regulator with XRE-family HTH domain